ncbi:hypothetical protein Tco_1156481 [Tanacetum coccineum]
MTSFPALVADVFVSAITFQSYLVHGNFYTNTYFNLSEKHSYIFGNGEDLHLVLDQSAGTEVLPKKRYYKGTSSRMTEEFSKSDDSGRRHWESKSRKQKSIIKEDDLYQP